MRFNSNKNIHKPKRDPYKTLIRLTAILAGLIVVGIGIFYLCSVAVTNDFVQKRDALDKQNEQAEIEFNTRMNELRSSRNIAIDPGTGEATPVELPFWETTLDGQIWRIEDESNVGLENTSTITLDRSSLINGGLLLINQWHSLPSDFTDTELVSIGTQSGFKIPVQDNTVKLFPNAFNALNELLTAAAEAEQKYYIVREGYRSNDYQTEIFNKRMEALSSDFSGDILIEQTKKEINYPGTSEYQTGQSFRMDLYSSDNPEAIKGKKFQTSEQGQWFTENCWKYGIAFRFPMADFPNSQWEDKSYKTGMTQKFNIYRYVGKPHAAAMRIMDYCLEEYVEFLIAHPHICIYQDGALRYEIVRISMNEAESFSLPVPNPASDYIASMDNMGGVVMGYIYN